METDRNDLQEMVSDAHSYLIAQGLRPTPSDVATEIELNYGVKLSVDEVKRLLAVNPHA